MHWTVAVSVSHSSAAALAFVHIVVCSSWRLQALPAMQISVTVRATSLDALVRIGIRDHAHESDLSIENVFMKTRVWNA